MITDLYKWQVGPTGFWVHTSNYWLHTHTVRPTTAVNTAMHTKIWSNPVSMPYTTTMAPAILSASYVISRRSTLQEIRPSTTLTPPNTNIVSARF